MLNEMQRQLQGQMPARMRLQPPQNLQRMTGSGEIWIDSQGLPRRQVMDLHMPEVDARYDAQTHLVIDFFRFGATSLVPDVVPGPDGGWQLQPLAPAAPRDAAITAPGLHLAAVWAGVRPVVLSPTWLLLFFALLLVVGFVRFYQRSPHRAYGFLAATMIAAMVSGPLLQVLEIVRFQEHMAHAASAEPVVNALGLTLDPASAKSEKPAISVEAEQAMARLLHGQAAPVDEQDTDPLFVACGVGSNTADSDDDGLSDFVENCYGTNYLLADTDFDGVPDGVETTGFEHNGRHWYGNALNGDTNGDGLSDAAAWSQPTGTAPAVDVDGDGIPNLWDGDSDGDGVPNGQDLAPFAVTPSKPAMTLNIADDGFDGYRTIELQIQPQNPAHLRYTLTTLDWPYDEQGQMRDLDGSSQDVRLVPYLTIEPNVAPSPDLREHYGVIYFEKTIDVNNSFFLGVSGNTYTQRTMMVPLVPQGTSAITNFYGKIPYQPGSGSIDWTNARLVWLVAGEVDTAFDCGRAEPCIRTESKVLHEYYEPFRLSGLRINKSGQHEMVLFGTPNSPTEDKSLLNLMYGMEGTFLEAEQMAGQAAGRTALGEIVNRFEQPSTPIELKWGVTELSHGPPGPYPCRSALCEWHGRHPQLPGQSFPGQQHALHRLWRQSVRLRVGGVCPGELAGQPGSGPYPGDRQQPAARRRAWRVLSQRRLCCLLGAAGIQPGRQRDPSAAIPGSQQCPRQPERCAAGVSAACACRCTITPAAPGTL
ncbi:hypothetical protein [Candidatus Amarobacter glycogenicus]|uniref:hypothetical protein n=2 Tax=Chloroflexota TaxID=200795 RepID=UPI002A11EFD3|nr:thrombospondin type 3 repeat-containing protein [Dehalococcoidia bacterium]